MRSWSWARLREARLRREARKGRAEPNRERARERMRKLHADPAFAEAHRERMRKLNADPAFNPLVELTDAERADYDVLVRRGGYARDDALRAIGRADLLPKAAE